MMIIKQIVEIMVLFGLCLLNANIELRMLDGKVFKPQSIKRIRVAGEGGFGKVTIYEIDGKQVALKEFKREMDYRSELKIHTHIKPLIKTDKELRVPQIHYTSENRNTNEYGIIMDAINGKTVYDYLLKPEIQSNDDVILKIVNDVNKIIDKLHDNDIYFLDIKGDNMMIDEDKQIWLIDVGLWQIVDNNWKNGIYYTGTPAYWGADLLKLYENINNPNFGLNDAKQFLKNGDKQILVKAMLELIYDMIQKNKKLSPFWKEFINEIDILTKMDSIDKSSAQHLKYFEKSRKNNYMNLDLSSEHYIKIRELDDIIEKTLIKYVELNKDNKLLSKLCQLFGKCNTGSNDKSHGNMLYYGIFIKIIIFAALFVI